MADRLTVKIVGTAQLNRALDRIDPSQNTKIISGALIESALLTIRTAAREHILPGGKGPPRPRILTSRTGTLRRSLSTSHSIDRRGLPRFIEAGSDLVYSRVHELGNRTHPKRAFLVPALVDSESQFESIFIKHWRRETGL